MLRLPNDSLSKHVPLKIALASGHQAISWNLTPAEMMPHEPLNANETIDEYENRLRIIAAKLSAQITSVPETVLLLQSAPISKHIDILLNNDVYETETNQNNKNPLIIIYNKEIYEVDRDATQLFKTKIENPPDVLLCVLKNKRTGQSFLYINICQQTTDISRLITVINSANSELPYTGLQIIFAGDFNADVEKLVFSERPRTVHSSVYLDRAGREIESSSVITSAEVTVTPEFEMNKRILNSPLADSAIASTSASPTTTILDGSAPAVAATAAPAPRARSAEHPHRFGLYVSAFARTFKPSKSTKGQKHTPEKPIVKLPGLDTPRTEWGNDCLPDTIELNDHVTFNFLSHENKQTNCENFFQTKGIIFTKRGFSLTLTSEQYQKLKNLLNSRQQGELGQKERSTTLVQRPGFTG